MPGAGDARAIEPRPERRIGEEPIEHDPRVSRPPPRREATDLARIAETVARMVHRGHDIAVGGERLGEPGEIRAVGAAPVRQQDERKAAWAPSDRRVPGAVREEDAVPFDRVLDGAARRGIPDRGGELPVALLVDEDAAGEA